MALSSDELVKREIIDAFGDEIAGLDLRIFPESSNDDQVLFTKGGLTFSYGGVDYGSCDAGWFRQEGDKIIPFMGLEATDALNRKSSGNAQYQRFHHALGAVKNGLIGVYYLRKGIDKIQEDLYGMALKATEHERGVYLIIDDLDDLRPVLENNNDPAKLNEAIGNILRKMQNKFNGKFMTRYRGSWEVFAEKRSTIFLDNNIVVKHAGRMRRNFTDGSQRAGHIAVGEMYLTKYFFYGKRIFYLMPKMSQEDIDYLDEHKASDKEWYLLRHEPMVEMKTRDNLIGLDQQTYDLLESIEDEPLKGDTLVAYNSCIKTIVQGLKDGTIKIQ